VQEVTLGPRTSLDDRDRRHRLIGFDQGFCAATLLWVCAYALALWLLTVVAHAQVASNDVVAPTFATKAEGRAWCRGIKFANDAVHQNRDHFMRLMNMDGMFKFETSEEALKRIYASKKHEGDPIEGIIGSLRDGVDLYVVPPRDLNYTIQTREGSVTCD
jgi:hypothetical protein